MVRRQCCPVVVEATNPQEATHCAPGQDGGKSREVDTPPGTETAHRLIQSSAPHLLDKIADGGRIERSGEQRVEFAVSVALEVEQSVVAHHLRDELTGTARSIFCEALGVGEHRARNSGIVDDVPDAGDTEHGTQPSQDKRQREGQGVSGQVHALLPAQGAPQGSALRGTR
jgi:hypothetical protein